MYPFVCICPKYRTIRLKYINRYNYVRPSVYKFYELLSSNDKTHLYNLACYAKALSTRNNSNLITIHYYLIVFSMYVYINNHFKGFFKLLLRLSTLTYYNLFSFIFCLYHYCYMMYMSVLKTMYYVHV